MKKSRGHADDLRGASRLAVEATQGVAALVETMHRTIAGGPSILGRPLEGPAKLATSLIYGSVRGVAGLIGAGIDAALESLSPLLGESLPGPEREAILAVLNGVLGDHLATTKNPLAIEMRLRKNGQPLELEPNHLYQHFLKKQHRLLVMIHGSCMNDLMWLRHQHDHGAALEQLGFTTLYLHYNSGRHVSENGAELSDLLEDLLAHFPGEVESIAIVAHSMGGLVARAACHSAEGKQLEWRSKLRKLVCLGTPHHGAPLERGGNWIEFLIGVSRYSAPFRKLAKIRSAGVTDLRFGNVREEDWKDRDRFERGDDPRVGLKLPAGVDCHAAAATSAAEGDLQSKKLPGDGLVPVDSALGRHPNRALALDFPEANQWLGLRMNHLDLLDRPEVFAVLKVWLGV